MNGLLDRRMSDARETIDRFYSIRLGVSLPDLKPGQVAVATCDRRTFAERGYGFIRLLWMVHFGDRAAISVHPAALAEVSRLAWRLSPDEIMADAFCAGAGRALAAALSGMPGTASGVSVTLYHPGDAAPVATDGEVRPLTPADSGKWVGERVFMSAAEHPSALRGEAFGLFLGEALIAETITHDPCVAEMAHLVVADGIEVSEAYRRRGYGKAVLAAWTRDMQARGRACLHSTSLENQASIATARSVGYIEYARTRSVRYNAPEDSP
jgi:ribosomal protein S18 acetylase RimI-like enzyme